MENKIYNILAINPGSTSTKAAFYHNLEPVAQTTIRHSPEEFKEFSVITQQKDVRGKYLLDFLEQEGIDPKTLDTVVGRGGLVKPIDSGAYRINDKMLQDLSSGRASTHASSLGGIMAAELGKQFDIPAYVVDPVVVDEMEPMAKLSGIPGIERKSVFHALNQKAVARACAQQLGMKYEDGRFVVAHMGGGITVGAHHYGRVVDVNDGLNGEGPFSPERTGGIPLVPLIEMCYSGHYTKEQMVTMVTRGGGMQSYLGTNDLQKVERMVKMGDEFAALVMDSMAYQVSKEIGAMAAVLEGRVNAIILTGGLAYSMRFTGMIKQRVDQIAQVITHPGEDEMSALVSGVLRILTGEDKPAVYQ